MDGRDELIRLRGEEIDRLNAELRELARHADYLNSRIVALDDERNAALRKLDVATKLAEDMTRESMRRRDQLEALSRQLDHCTCG